VASEASLKAASAISLVPEGILLHLMLNLTVTLVYNFTSVSSTKLRKKKCRALQSVTGEREDYNVYRNTEYHN
jgi:hypothetical protein